MTIKKAILIGTLLATTIALITIGVKTGSFDNKNKENYKPKLLSRNSTAIRVNAEDAMPVSLNWLLNTTLSTTDDLQSTNINFKCGLYAEDIKTGSSSALTTLKPYTTNYNKISYNHTYRDALSYGYKQGSYQEYLKPYNRTNQVWINIDARNNTFNYNNARVLMFETSPTGTLLTWLNTWGTPLYNNNIIISNETGLIREVTKQDTPLTLPQQIRNDGLVKIYLDQAISELYINDTKYTDFNAGISIANQNIFITTSGTPAGQTGYIFKINYTNSLTPIEPYPDPVAPYYEVIDLKPLMLNILTMPFTFISQAFNVTLWPGTQYEFNISNFILSIIAIATILFIIRLFTSGFSVIGNYTGARNDKAFKKSQTRLNNAKAKNIENNTPRKSESHVTMKKEK